MEKEKEQEKDKTKEQEKDKTKEQEKEKEKTEKEKTDPSKNPETPPQENEIEQLKAKLEEMKKSMQETSDKYEKALKANSDLLNRLIAQNGQPPTGEKKSHSDGLIEWR